MSMCAQQNEKAAAMAAREKSFKKNYHFETGKKRSRVQNATQVAKFGT